MSEPHMPKYLAKFGYRVNLRKVPKQALSTPKNVLEAPPSQP